MQASQMQVVSTLEFEVCTNRGARGNFDFDCGSEF